MLPPVRFWLVHVVTYKTNWELALDEVLPSATSVALADEAIPSILIEDCALTVSFRPLDPLAGPVKADDAITLESANLKPEESLSVVMLV